jgi:hypothetical protein
MRSGIPPRPAGDPMKSLMPVLALALAAITLPSHAADAASAPKAQSKQNEKMTQCNKDAAGMKGDERKAFMSKCLSAEGSSTAKNSQNEKMKSCNASATGKTGDERKAYMSECLSK